MNDALGFMASYDCIEINAVSGVEREAQAFKVGASPLAVTNVCCLRTLRPGTRTIGGAFMMITMTAPAAGRLG